MTRRSRKRLFILALLSPLVLLIVGSIVYLLLRHGRPAPQSGGEDGGRPEAAAAAAPSRGEPGCLERTVIIRRGETLSDILSGYGFSGSEVESFKQSVTPVFNPARIVAGRELRLSIDPFLIVQRLEYDQDEETCLVVRRTADAFAAEVKRIPYVTRIAYVQGTIEDTPIGAFNKSGEGDVLAMNFAEVFAWDVDFYLDTRQGDAFRLIVEKRYLDDEFVSYGEILAAEYVNAGKLYQAYRFTYPDTGRSDYFDAAGGSLRKEFLKSPLKYGRITSRFTASRFHPTLKKYRAHYAVDYAAAVGTPVKATAAGTVILAGWNGGAGRMIKVRHKGGYVTMYLHLSRFADGLKVNTNVAAGEVIGYVGASGEASGPHLDYRIQHHGSYINPLGYRFKPAEPLRPECLKDFLGKVAAARFIFDWPLRIR